MSIFEHNGNNLLAVQNTENDIIDLVNESCLINITLSPLHIPPVHIEYPRHGLLGGRWEVPNKKTRFCEREAVDEEAGRKKERSGWVEVIQCLSDALDNHVIIM